MRNPIRLFVILPLLALLIGCGGQPTTTNNKSGLPPIDPSGNWTITATDADGNSETFSTLFFQTGSTVTAVNFLAPDNPLPFHCEPWLATFTNGTVQNVNNFTGDVDASYAIDYPSNMTRTSSTWSFDTTLAPDGKSFTGTYSNMPSCAALAASGTLTGAEVPSVSGTWTGVIQSCDFNTQDGSCPVEQGTAQEPIVLMLSQNDSTGNVTGSFQVSGDSVLSTGTVGLGPEGVLSGLLMQVSLYDSDGNEVAVIGGFPQGGRGLTLQGQFTAILNVDSTEATYALTMTQGN
jgi:hypothetical protein